MSPVAILYLHGFNSSPASTKAGVFVRAARTAGYQGEIAIPALPYSPAAAMKVAETWIAARSDPSEVGVVGSSLGGYYACWLAHRYGVRAALINPALNAPELLAAYLGANTNLYTGEAYELTPAHLQELLALRVPEVRHPKDLLLLSQTGDETLDWRDAVRRLPQSPAWIEGGGSHQFEGFDRVVPVILGHLSGRDRSAH